MRFSVGTITQCEGGNHRAIPVTAEGVTKALDATRDQILELVASLSREERVMLRLYFALLESGAGMSLAAWNAALSGREYEA